MLAPTKSPVEIRGSPVDKQAMLGWQSSNAGDKAGANP
jgi:hypothetical protein